MKQVLYFWMLFLVALSSYHLCEVTHRGQLLVDVDVEPVHTTCCSYDDVIWVGDVLTWKDGSCGGYGRLHTLEGKKILFVGDSQSRRLAKTAQLLLEHFDEHLNTTILSKDRAVHSFITLSKLIQFQWAPCLKDILRHSHKFDKYDIVIASYGAHVFKCKNDTLRMINTLSHVEHMIWRTQPFPSSKVTNLTNYENVLNHTKHVWPPQRLHDHQHIMRIGGRDRENRIQGDTRNHLGYLARLALLQYSEKVFRCHPPPLKVRHEVVENK